MRDAHALPRGAAAFAFPHFMIVGFQKAATTSLFAHLAEHPALRASKPKEPEFFRLDCGMDLDACPPAAARAYLRETLHLADFVAGGGATGHFEASTHYVRNAGRLAPQLRARMPWLRVVFSMREPISRAASMLIHNMDKHGRGCLARKDLGECLWTGSQIRGDRAGGEATNYSLPLQRWIAGWPREQLHVIQVRGCGRVGRWLGRRALLFRRALPAPTASTRPRPPAAAALAFVRRAASPHLCPTPHRPERSTRS